MTSVHTLRIVNMIGTKEERRRFVKKEKCGLQWNRVIWAWGDHHAIDVYFRRGLYFHRDQRKNFLMGNSAAQL